MQRQAGRGGGGKDGKNEKEKGVKNSKKEVIYGSMFLAHYLRGLKRPVKSVAAMEPVNRGGHFLSA